MDASPSSLAKPTNSSKSDQLVGFTILSDPKLVEGESKDLLLF